MTTYEHEITACDNCGAHDLSHNIYSESGDGLAFTIGFALGLLGGLAGQVLWSAVGRLFG